MVLESPYWKPTRVLDYPIRMGVSPCLYLQIRLVSQPLEMFESRQPPSSLGCALAAAEDSAARDSVLRNVRDSVAELRAADTSKAQGPKVMADGRGPGSAVSGTEGAHVRFTPGDIRCLPSGACLNGLFESIGTINRGDH